MPLDFEADELTQAAGGAASVHGAAVNGNVVQVYYSASSNPTANNDGVDTAGLGEKFFKGSIWVNEATNSRWQCDDITTGAAVWSAIGGDPKAYPTNYFDNGGLWTYLTTTTFSMSAWNLRNAADTADLNLAAMASCDMGAAYDTGTGVLSSSLTIAANTTYHVFAVTGGTNPYGVDTSVTGANLVNDHGLTIERMAFAFLTNTGAATLPILHTSFNGGDVRATFDAPIADVSLGAGAGSTAGVAVTMSVPQGIEVLLQTALSVWDSAANGILVTETRQANTIPTGANVDSYVNATIVFNWSSKLVMTDTSGQIRHREMLAGIVALGIASIAYTFIRS